jgi:PTH1 family peptidyl-tRNA hydrolase
MKLIVGLGNPGSKYEKTRHNFGWRVIDQLQEHLKLTDWHSEKKIKSLICQASLNRQKIILAKPETLMNNSGLAVKKIANYYRIPIEEVLVIHDDIDLPLGQIKIQRSRGAAGHKGVQSIINHLGSKDFIRMRMGIRPAQTENIDTEKFVLEKFTNQEEKIVQETIEKAARLIRAAI